MRRVPSLLFVTLLFLVTPATAAPAEQRTCGIFHFVRPAPGGSEIGTASVVFRNADLENSVTIARLTIRDVFGVVVHESGPAIGVPHPLNGDFFPGLDITVVPPGGSYYVSTNHIWGNNPIPGTPGRGNSMTAIVEFETDGHGDLVGVARSLRVRERFFTASGPQQGVERSRSSAACAELK